MKKNIYLSTLMLPLALLLFSGSASAQSICASIVKNIGKDKESSMAQFPTKINDKIILFFASDEYYGLELWRTDGTNQGTQIVKNINPGLQSSIRESGFVGSKPAAINGILIFEATDKSGVGIWRSDGTEVGTYKVASLGTSSEGAYFKLYKNAIYFWDQEGRLWKTQGAQESTVRLSEKLRGGLMGEWAPMIEFKNELWFATNIDIWKTDGTIQGTVALGVKAEFSTGIIGTNDKLYFILPNSNLYQTDGTLAGTSIAREKIAYSALLYPESNKMQAANGLAYFYGSDNTLWRSDGTLLGTYSLTNLYPDNFFSYKNELYYTATESNKTRIWKTDGTVSGSKLVVDVLSGQNINYKINNITEQDGIMYFNVALDLFAASDLKKMYEGIWQSDGTQEGTRLICVLSDGNYKLACSALWSDIKAGSGLTAYPAFVKLNSQLFFIGTDPYNRYGKELYSTNITNCPNITATIGGTTALCPGGNTVLTATATGGTAPYAYRWQQGTVVVGTGAASLTVNAAGTYTLTATDANGCTGTAQVTATQRTAPTVSLPAMASFCAGQTTTLTATAAGGTSPYSFGWKQGTTAVGTSAGTLSVNAGGTYGVTVTDAGGCASSSATATVTQRPSPAATITASAPSFTTGNSVTLTANTGTGLTYQWTRDGQSVVGATQATYVAQQPGLYGLTVSQDGCSTTATATQISLITAIEEPQTGPDFTLMASPNPSPGAVQVRIVTQPGRTVSVTLTLRDLTGRSLWQKQISVSGQHTESLDLSIHPGAIYLLNATSNAQKSSLRLLRQ